MRKHGQRVLVHAFEALDYCARAMDGLQPEDGAREDVRTIYLVASQVKAAHEGDDLVAVPRWLVTGYSANQGDGEKQSSESDRERADRLEPHEETLAYMRAAEEIRQQTGTRWFRGAPSHVFAELAKQLNDDGFALCRPAERGEGRFRFEDEIDEADMCKTCRKRAIAYVEAEQAAEGEGSR